MPHNYYKPLNPGARLVFALLFASATLAQAANLRFAWNASSDPNVAGYNLSYGTTSGRYTKSINAGSATSTTVSLTPGATYYFVVTAYNSIGLQSSPSNELALTVDNQPPSVSLTSPQANSSFTANSSIGLSASASDPDGTITKVEFYRDTNKIGESNSAPYATTWNNAPSGSYTLTALAFDDSGTAVRSSGVPISISGATAGPTPRPNRGPKIRALAVSPIVKAGGMARIKLVASEPPTQNTVVNYSLGGSATAGVHYSMAGMTGQVAIPAGRRSVLMAMQTLPASAGGGNHTIVMSVAQGDGYTLGRGNAVVRVIGR